MTATPDDLFRRLEALNIATTTTDYPAHSTVEEGIALRGEMAGMFTKNLLLRDKKKALYLLAVEENRAVDLKILHRRIGARGRLGFAPGEIMIDLLGVEPGALTPFALINDLERAVTPVLDAVLFTAEQVNFHPLVQTGSTGIAPDDLAAFLKAVDHEPVIVDFDIAIETET